jgi:hypothetical protein
MKIGDDNKVAAADGYEVDAAELQARINSGDVKVNSKKIRIDDPKRGIKEVVLDFEEIEALTAAGAAWLARDEKGLAESVTYARGLGVRAAARGAYIAANGAVDKSTTIEKAVANFRKLGLTEEAARAAVAAALASGASIE